MSTEPSVVISPTRSNQVVQCDTSYRLFTPREGEILGERHFNCTTRLHINAGGDREVAIAGWRVAEGLFRVNGISYITMRPFQANVFRALAFDWEDLHDQILYVMEAANPRFPQLGTAPRRAAPRRICWYSLEGGRALEFGLTRRLFHPRHSLDSERHIKSARYIQEGSLDADKPFLPRATAAIEALLRLDAVTSLTVHPFGVVLYLYGQDCPEWSEQYRKQHQAIVNILCGVFPGDAPVTVGYRRYV